MSTSASLVVGADGSTTKDQRSHGVSSQADRAIFLARRREVDVIIIGGNTARNEPYLRTPVPLVVISRSQINPIPANPKAQLWNTSPATAIINARKTFGPRILIEGGALLLHELLEQGLIDDFYLTVTPHRHGENMIDWQGILNRFTTFTESQIDETLFFHAHN